MGIIRSNPFMSQTTTAHLQRPTKARPGRNFRPNKRKKMSSVKPLENELKVVSGSE